nr:unnamed protein product [Digitaria exilis]
MNMDVVTVASPAGSSGGGSYSRIYGPRNFEDEFVIAKNQDEINRVLAKIERICDQVHLDDELVANNGGFCFGLLSPTTNILINSVISAASTPPLHGGRVAHGGRDMNQRSLDGLIVFLTCLFPYLPDGEAMAYLDAADADPLVAALLVINCRGLRRFGFSSDATAAAVEAALRGAADHPDPRRLVLGWKLLSRNLNNVVDMKPDSIIRRVVDAMRESSDTDLQLKKPWELAEARRLDLDGDNPMGKELRLPPARGAMKRVFLATIHGFYLQALARLPTAELRSRYHRSMLEGGYCYGPLDPVSNIIVNTVWYDQSFLSSSNQVSLDMISTKSLRRAAARSLYGLVSFLCTRYQSLSPDQALQRLLVAGADLRVADPKLFDDCDMVDTCDGRMKKRSAEPDSTFTSVAEAYAAAATAAFHRSPLAQRELLGSPDAVSKLKIASGMLHLEDGRMLSCDDLGFLSTVLLNCSSSVGKPHLEHVQAPVQVRKRLCAYEFWGQHERARRKVAAALDKFNETMVPKYRLHVICGVNELVSGPELSSDMEDRCYYPLTHHDYHHSHINFLATREGSGCASAPAMLFFAECSNRGTGGTCWCVPVSLPHPDAEQVRCIYCEHQGIRIVHPDERNFHGRDEFEKLFYGSDRRYDNDNLVMKKTVDWVHDVKDDAIYCSHVDKDDDRHGNELMIS